MAPDQYAQMLAAMAELETRVNATVAAGLHAGNATVAALTSDFHKALLDQERRNSTFADREHVDSLSSQVQRHAVRLSTLEDSYSTILTRLDEVSQQVAAGSLSLLSGFANYLVLALLMLSSNLIVYILAHLAGK